MIGIIKLISIFKSSIIFRITISMWIIKATSMIILLKLKKYSYSLLVKVV
ncbi:hypothetical protein BVRB_1g004260 [Beta vulgaris subsp. vulgaris]|nr:hypothetical protein BVRB_1g004260 [Beta vulgaris subsp. vulgaris]